MEFWKCYTKDFDFALFLYCHVGRDLNILVGRKEGFRKKKDREHAGKKGTIVFLK